MINYPSTPSDLNDLPYPSKSDVGLFVGGIGTGGSANNWKIWNKPKGSTMTNILVISGGGGGGGGAQRAAGGDGGGGGGAGSSGLANLIIPSFFLPDILYVLAGDGGSGGAVQTAGTAGGISYVSFSPTITAPNVLIQSNAAAPGGGGGGTQTVVGTAGVAGTIAVISTGANLGLFTAIAGQIGVASPAVNGNNAGNGITAWATIPLSAGASGASNTGGNSTGGVITATAATTFTYINWPVTAGAVAGGGAAGVKGSAGVNLLSPLRTSGAGGGGSNDTTGGDGNSAGIGSGGSGGGPCATGGRGGNGGPGLVIITSW